MTHKHIADSLGIEPRNTTITIPKKSGIPETTEQLHDQSHQNIKNIAEIGEMAMYELAQLAAQTENPKAYEVLAKLMNEVISANEKLLELKSKKIDLERKEMGAETKNVTNNLFVGSTAEMLEKMREGKQ